MSCGKKPVPKTDILAKLKDLSSKKIEMNLNQFNLLFDNNTAEWRSTNYRLLYFCLLINF